MKASQIMFAAAAAVSATVMAGETLTVSNKAYMQMNTATNVVAGATAKQDAVYPAGAVQPLFWLDCSDRTGWVSDPNSASVIVKIPSKAGSKLEGVRWLTTDLSESDWKGWLISGEYKGIANKPKLYKNVTDLMDGQGAYLAFYPASWRSGMVFNAVNQGGDAPTSVLKNFGTVLWVRGSNLDPDGNGVRTGGYLLGGTPGDSDAWMRGGNPVVQDEWNGRYAWNSRLVHNSASRFVQNGRIWLDGQLGAPGLMSYNGHWEVVSLQCADNTAETLGLGVDLLSSSDSSGSELIAEMLIFDEVLTREQIEPIEMYLQQKWFGRGRAGWNGDARLGVLVPHQQAYTGEIDVTADETLEISRVQGGSHAGALRKTGAGALALSDDGVKNYTGDLVLEEGKLEFGALRTAPASVDALADHLYARFDPSVTESLVTETADKTYVDVWSNLVTTAEAKTYGLPFCLRPYVANKRPWVLADALGDGLNVVDFGWFVNQGVDSLHMAVSVATTGATGSGNNAAKFLHNIQTVVLVLGAQGGGGHLFNSAAFARGNRNASSVRTSIFSDAVISKFGNTNPPWGPDITGREQTVWINGRVWDEKRGYETTGYQVVAFQTAGASFSKLLMEDQAGYSGGARIGEMLLWNRTLTEQEIRDAQAYLSAKWLKRATPGYKLADDTGTVAEIQNLSVPAGKTATIDVAEGRTVRVDTLKAEGTLVKTGKGELKIRQASGEGSVTVADGAIKTVAARDVDDVNSYAEGATMHVDASDAASLSLKVRSSDGEAVINWADKENRVNLRNSGFTADMSRTPHINVADCNGMDTVDFGYWGDADAALPTHGGCWMFLDRPLHSMRAIYAVIKYHGHDAAGNGPRLGFLFSNQAASTGVAQIGESDALDFHPDVSNGWTDMFLQSDREELKGGCFTNGVSTIVSNFHVPLDEYFLLELHPSVGYTGGVMGMDRTETGRIGGFAVGELIVYEHPLSEREKVATRNYLLRKWFPGKALSQMPEPTAAEPFGGNLTLGKDAPWSVAVKADFTTDDAKKLTGTLGFESGVTLNLTELGALGDLFGHKVLIAEAGGFEGLENVTVAGDVVFDPYAQPRLVATKSGKLYVKFGRTGAAILVR